MYRSQPAKRSPMQHDHDQGLAHDLEVLKETTRQRRRMALGWLAGAAGFGSLAMLGCGGGGSEAGTGSSTSASTGSTGSGTSTGGSTSTGTTSSCTVIPTETNGPFPADGSNTANGTIANALTLSGIVRSDIRSSFAGATGTAAGVPLTLTLTLVNAGASCADLAGYAIYIWHCDRNGEYSMYGADVINQNYLRGVQTTAADGTVTFTTIFPACYSGRMPHIHVEVYASTSTATSYTKSLKTTQIAFPVAVCSTVYSTAAGYSASISNFAQISFATDMVFSDGVTYELATVTGDVSSGYAASLTLGIAA